MHPVAAAALIPGALTAVYLFLIAPGRRPEQLKEFRVTLYAHRGLWNDRRPENSRAAFSAAVEKGYGIETDVRVSADGKLFLLHDDSLRRMTGDDRSAGSLTMEELSGLKLNGTEETIPAFDDLLDIVGGKVPLIIEIKTGPRVKTTCRLTDERLRSYKGQYMVESFDPRAVRWFRKHSPGTIRGQLAMGVPGDSSRKRSFRFFLLSSLAVDVIGRPHFIAMRHDTVDSLPMRLVRLFHPYLVAWTVRSPERMKELENRYDCRIFEGFEP